ncbi:46094_t:CDS:2, partial [Gigaspora margarita]
EFILVINDDDEEELVKATKYNTVNEVTTDSVRETNMNKSHEIERFRKESLFLWQENDHKYLHLIKENERNFTNLEHSTDIKNERKKRILADLEIGRLLNKLNLIKPSSAYEWYQIFKSESDIKIIESKIKDLDKFIHKQLIPEFKNVFNYF